MGFYRIAAVAMPLDHTVDDLRRAVASRFGFGADAPLHVVRKSVDARHRRDLKIVYTVDVEAPDGTRALRDGMVHLERPPRYELHGPFPALRDRPIVVGAGPAGLFAALLLAEHGAAPVVVERGKPVAERIRDVADYLATGRFDADSNVQFGEGGAGTFSDGKIYTGVRDRRGRIGKVMETLLACGAPEEVRHLARPHIGTDRLVAVVRALRERITLLGGTFRFGSRMDGLILRDGAVAGITLAGGEELPGDRVVLAIGHSARDTFARLERQEVPLAAKAFAVGLRVEHPQEMITRAQYGRDIRHPHLPVADYKLAFRTTGGRAVYTFCMCPGGYVVDASSEDGHAVCNGMSLHERDGCNANSAVIVNVRTDDFEGGGPLAGVAFQRRFERAAFELGGAHPRLPVQRFDDFVAGVAPRPFGAVRPQMKGDPAPADLTRCLPAFVARAIREGMADFGRRIRGFDRGDAVLTGVETRSSSPVRILRGETLMSPIRGLHPCGEGAGYAGGIMSAALDGLKAAEAILTGRVMA